MNYRMTNTSLNQFKERAEIMLDNTCALRAVGFPLDDRQVINGILTQAQQDAVELVKDIIYTYHTRSLKVAVPSGNHTAYVGVMLQKEYTNFRQDSLRFDLDTLAPGVRALFEKWLDENLSWARKVKVAKDLIKKFLMDGNEYHGGSMASINARWPELMVVPLSMHSPWPERAREIPTIRRSEYEWPMGTKLWDWYLDNGRRMEIVGGMLAGAQMLNPIEDKSPTTAKVVDWLVDLSKKAAA